MSAERQRVVIVDALDDHGRFTVEGRLRVDLALWRAAHPLDPEDLVILFGVGGDTLQRIEQGEVIPSDELAARIRCVIDRNPVGVTASSGSGRPSAAGARDEAAAGDLVAASFAKPISAWLTRDPSRPRGWLLQILHADGSTSEITIEMARRWIAQLAPLIALIDDPERYGLAREERG